MINSNAALDIVLSMISAYTSIKGTTAPYTAEEKSHSRASNDYLRAIGVTRISSLYHVAILIATYFQCRKIISLDGSLLQDNFYTDGSVILFRLMNLVNISGGILRVICFRVLGRFFTFDLAVQKDQKVIQSGPYAIVRHPSYSAMLLHQIGTSFSMGVYGPLIPTHWRKRSALIHTGLSIFALTLISLRIRDEEKMLVSELGPEYKEYKTKVRSKVIPYVL